MKTFAESAKHATTQEHREVVKIKQTQFARPLEELYGLRSQWRTQQEEFRTRLTAVQQRIQLAVSAGVDFVRIERLISRPLYDLTGEGMKPGLLDSIGRQIEAGITKMEKFSVEQLPQRAAWICWPAVPTKVRDCISAVEDCLMRLEPFVIDGGPLHQMVEAVAERKAGQAAA